MSMTNEEKARDVAWNLFDDGLFYHNHEYQRREIQAAIIKMADWKDEQVNKTLIDFMRYLDKRGFFKDDLCFDLEHQVETFIELQNREE